MCFGTNKHSIIFDVTVLCQYQVKFNLVIWKVNRRNQNHNHSIIVLHFILFDSAETYFLEPNEHVLPSGDRNERRPLLN